MTRKNRELSVVGSFIHELFQKSGISQINAARYLGLNSRQEIQNFLSAKNPSIYRVSALLDLFGYEVVLQPRGRGKRVTGTFVVPSGKEQWVYRQGEDKQG